ncbi:MAG: MraY family glycosyltransferase [Victivallaceae bacterium]|nr:MraY family glycosyltransferase [Victivallaceae bacterium]
MRMDVLPIWDIIYLFAFLGGAMATLLLTPLFLWVARKLDFMDRPASNHKGHTKATPLLGGAALLCGWLLCVGVGLLAVFGTDVPYLSRAVGEHLAGIRAVGSQLGVIVIGAGLFAMLGLADDKWAFPAGRKFFGQFLIAAVVATWGGVRVNILIDAPPLAWCATVFWIMFMVNAINFFDNMDGLAVGVITIAMAFFTVIAALNCQFFYAVFSAMTCGVCAGFWYYNTTPAVIFMGDSGSHFIGYLAAVVAAGVTYFGRDYSQSHFALLMPIFILALPLFDTAMVVAIRLRNHKPFWIGDHNHISHRFLHMGMSRRRAVLLVHLLAVAIGLGTLPIFRGDLAVAAVVTIQSGLVIFIITMLQFTLASTSNQNGEK